MKNKYLIVLAAVAMTALSAEQSAVAKSDARVAQALSLSAEEQAFAAKLGETTRQAFALMSVDLRHEVLALMKNPALTADAAVEQVMKDHPASSIKVEVNTK